jgi:cytochrome c oxidase subunit 2
MLNKLMGIVPNASEHGYLVDHMLEFCHWFMGILFVGWSLYFFYAIWRFHRGRNPHASYHGVQSKASAHVEFAVVLIEAVLLLGFALPLWGKRVNADQFPDRDEALRVHAVGEQFAWHFHYPGPDGVFGPQEISLVTTSNPLGLDYTKAAAQDDFYSKNELYLVNKKPTVIEITSKDVIHSFSVHHMRVDQDAIPGTRIPMWFRPIVKGEYEIVCAQLCGANHYAMRAMMLVKDQAEFNEWSKDIMQRQHPQTAAPAGAAPAPGAAPATPAPAAAH